MKTLSDNAKVAFMGHNPTKLKELKNAQGQLCEFFEHPTKGDEAAVYVLIEGYLANTGFYDLGDFYEGSEYFPELRWGKIDCRFIFERGVA